jgi:bifunctional UDP-N-acetylglucosamine pyrophosphorylase/glucosamine-1-phosphate N-acetyltransferase
MMHKTAAVVLAAGQGTRMRSKRAKVLHELAGRPLLDHVLRVVAQLPITVTRVVVGYQADAVAEVVGGRAELVTQPGVLGTGDAVRRVLPTLPQDVTHVLVLYGDGPLVPDRLLVDLLAQQDRADAVIVTAEMAKPHGYGRVLRDARGAVRAIVEDKEATAAERAISEINTGIGVWRRQGLEEVLPTLPPHGEEIFLTDAVGAFLARGYTVATVPAPDPERVMGINTRQDLARAEAILRQEILDDLMANGVTIVDPATTFVDAGVEVGMDTVILPMTQLRGRTVVGEGVRIGPMATIVDSFIGDHVVVGQAVIEGSRVGPRSDVGPWSHLRPGTYLERDVHIGNFVELKNARMGLGSKAGHHCYLGDVTIGAHVNIGAGTVVVNYDGQEKHHTFIGDDAFIGCNANLVAPVEIGPGAYVAAGSTVTHNVPAMALAIARARQENKAEWARERRQPSRS